VGKVISKPIQVEIPTGRDVVLVVEGTPVVYIRHNETSERYAGRPKEYYVTHEYVASGITLKVEDSYLHKYVGSCANTMALEVDELTMNGIVSAINNRYHTQKGN